jgi:hypothetical protein
MEFLQQSNSVFFHGNIPVLSECLSEWIRKEGGKERKREGRGEEERNRTKEERMERQVDGRKGERKEGGREGGREEEGKKEGRKEGRKDEFNLLGHKFSRSKDCGPRVILGSLTTNMEISISDQCITYMVKLVMNAGAGICTWNCTSCSSEALFSILQEIVVKA